MNSGFGRRSTGRRDEFDFMDEPAAFSPRSNGSSIDKSLVISILSAITLFGVGFWVAQTITENASSSPNASFSSSSTTDHLKLTMADKGTDVGYRKLVALQAMAADKLKPMLPKRAGKSMTLFDVRTSGVLFEYRYRINVRKSQVNSSKFISVGRKGLRRKICNTGSMRRVLAFGGVYKYTYYDKNNQFIQSFNISEDACT